MLLAALPKEVEFLFSNRLTALYDAPAAYNQQFRPWVEEVQDTARLMLHTYLVPQTEEAIRARNAQPMPF